MTSSEHGFVRGFVTLAAAACFALGCGSDSESGGATTPDAGTTDGNVPDGTLPDGNVPDGTLPDGGESVCDDGTCTAGEDCASCPADCGACAECDATTPAEMMACASRDRFLAGIQTVAVAREPGTAGWQSAQDYCATTLNNMGFNVELQNYGTGVNVVGTKLGTDKADEQVLVLAHYDHVGTCTGADDNASGVSAILEMSRILSRFEFSRTLVVLCADEEENGRIGSYQYARQANNAGDKIAAVVNIDSIAYADESPNSQGVPAGFEEQYPEQAAALAANDYRGDYIMLGHDPYVADVAAAFQTHGESLGLKVAPVQIDVENLFMPENMRSDSASFWSFAYPGAILNDTSELRDPCYHCNGCEDSVASLDIDFGFQVTQAALATVADCLDGLNAVFERPTTVPCGSLCSKITTEDQALCVANMLADNLDLVFYPACHEGITTVAECNACISSLPLLDGDCSLINFSCAM